ncbi:MAG: peptidoglycan DD-metalloendopeptidase family protein [Clostridia bacterium]|nr:peptidoglycan DD-metalloendopeptidase family protein [Clostridia bacterium]
MAYKIKYGNKVITTVSDTEVYYAAVNKVADMVESENIEEVLPEVQIEVVVTLDETFDTCDEVADAIIDNTEEIVSASKLMVDGEVVACVDTDSLTAALEARKAVYDIEGEDCESGFVEDVSLTEGYFVLSEISDISEVESLIAGLHVKTTVNESHTEEIDYSTVTKEDADKLVGYKNVLQSGEKGIKTVKAGVVYINGEKTEETTLSVETVKEPVDEIVEVGTKKPKTETVRFSSGLCFPLPTGVWEISCPYGKNGHKGVDLRAPFGTPILAAASGTVIEASYSGSYGNCVVIDHGNGIKTLYAHASTIAVKVGDTVRAGETVALVGSTGYSTGNHLHFEIHVGENRINPQRYIGL